MWLRKWISTHYTCDPPPPLPPDCRDQNYTSQCLLWGYLYESGWSGWLQKHKDKTNTANLTHAHRKPLFHNLMKSSIARWSQGEGTWAVRKWWASFVTSELSPLSRCRLKSFVNFQVMNMDRTSFTYLMIFYILVSSYGRTEGKSEGIFQIDYSY